MKTKIKITKLPEDGRANLANIDPETATNIKRVAVQVENYIRVKASLVPGEKSQALLGQYVKDWVAENVK